MPGTRGIWPFQGIGTRPLTSQLRHNFRLYIRANSDFHLQIHPFTPIPLVFCAEFAQRRKNRNPAFETLFNSMLSSLRDLSVVNMLAETCLAKFNDFNPQIDKGNV